MKKLRFLGVLMVFAALISGCFSGGGILSMPSFSFGAPSYADANNYITLSVNDMRKDKNIIGYVKNSEGSVDSKIKPNEPLASWLRAGLVRELGVKKINVVANSDEAGANVIVNIREFYANINGLGTNNMRGNFTLDITIKKGSNTTNKSLSQPMSDFAFMPSLSSLEPFAKTLLIDMLKRSANEIASGL